MGKLRDQMLADLQLCGVKPRTQETYLREAENLAKYFNRSPAELGENELKEYLLWVQAPDRRWPAHKGHDDEEQPKDLVLIK